jgi:hypothetical protein
MKQHFDFTTELLLNDEDEFHQKVEIEVEYEAIEGYESFFDKVFGNWVSNESSITLKDYRVYDHYDTLLDNEKLLTLNPKLINIITKKLEQLE